MNKIVLGSIVLSGKNFTFDIPSMSIYSTAAYGQLVEPEVEITITDSSGKLNPYVQNGFYDNKSLRGEQVTCYDYDDNIIYIGFVSRFDTKNSDLILYAQSPLAYGMNRSVDIEAYKLYPSDAVYQTLVAAGLLQYIDIGTFIAANAYYAQYPQFITIDTEGEATSVSDIINNISKLCSVSIGCNEIGMIEFKVMGAYVPIPSITITANEMITEPTKDSDLSAYNAYAIQVLDNSSLIAKNSTDGESVNEYGTLEYSYTPSNGIYVNDYASAVIFGEKKRIMNMYPLRKLVVGVKNDVLSKIHDEVSIEYINESYNGIYMIAAKKFDAYVTELTLIEIPTDRIEASLDYLNYNEDFGYGYGVFNTSTWGR